MSVGGLWNMKEKRKVKYYSFKASTFWAIIIACVLLILGLLFICQSGRKHTKSDTVHIEYGTIISQLKNTEECYLCGNTDESMMEYYRKFDTIGVIGLNQWVVMDLRLKEYDSEGNPIAKEGNSSDHSNMQGVEYSIDATPSRGKTSATIISTERMFNETVVKEHLCQECLDKVTETLASDTVKGHEEYLPFCIVDFKTLELYPVQQAGHSYFVRDYWVQVESVDEEIEVEVYYLPKE